MTSSRIESFSRNWQISRPLMQNSRRLTQNSRYVYSEQIHSDGKWVTTDSCVRYLCQVLVQLGKSDVKLIHAGCRLIQNEIKTMTDTIATLTDQLREQQRIKNDQHVEIRRLQQQEVETTKLQNAVNDLEARSRHVVRQTSTAGWLRSLISLISHLRRV